MGCIKDRQENPFNFVSAHLADDLLITDPTFDICELIASAPTNLVAVANANEGADLTWELTEDETTLNVEVQRKIGDGNFEVIATLSADAEAYSDNNIDIS